jgi:hypothetical protein
MNRELPLLTALALASAFAALPESSHAYTATCLSGAGYYGNIALSDRGEGGKLRVRAIQGYGNEIAGELRLPRAPDISSLRLAFPPEACAPTGSWPEEIRCQARALKVLAIPFSGAPIPFTADARLTVDRRPRPNGSAQHRVTLTLRDKATGRIASSAVDFGQDPSGNELGRCRFE